MRLLEVKSLTKRYPKFTLKNVSFSLEQGRIIRRIFSLYKDTAPPPLQFT